MARTPRALLPLCLLALVAFARAAPGIFQCADWSMGRTCQRAGPTTVAISDNGDTIGSMHSVNLYQHGVFSVDIKFFPHSTANIITAFYLIDTQSASNKDPNHFEIDIEFYGAEDPAKTMMATNVFFGGQQNLAQFSLPFDASADFHTYSMVWNARGVIWLVDNVPVRVLNKSPAHAYPETPMQALFTVWPQTWGGGQADYTNGPITHLVTNINFQGCAFETVEVGATACVANTSAAAPWNAPLTKAQLAAIDITPDGGLNRATLLNAWGWDTA